MHIEKMKSIQEKLVECVENQDLKEVNTKEFGQAIDMLKDLSEAIYYSTITKSMEQIEQEDYKTKTINYYGGSPRYYTPNSRMSDQYMPYGLKPDNEEDYYRKWEIAERNPRGGKSPTHRIMYMEGKEKHKDTPSQLRELEAYFEDLSSDITEMMKDASPEEKATLHQKMTMIVNKLT